MGISYMCRVFLYTKMGTSYMGVFCFVLFAVCVCVCARARVVLLFLNYKIDPNRRQK